MRLFWWRAAKLSLLEGLMIEMYTKKDMGPFSGWVSGGV